MSAAENGGPAFPQYRAMATPSGGIHYDMSGGMSLRDYFAGQALSGFAVENTEVQIQNGETPDEAHRRCWQQMAVSAYVAADAMIAERSKP